MVNEKTSCQTATENLNPVKKVYFEFCFIRGIFQELFGAEIGCQHF